MEQCHTQVVIDFDGPKGYAHGAIRSFKRKYMAIIEEFGNGELAATRTRLDELSKKRDSTATREPASR